MVKNYSLKSLTVYFSAMHREFILKLNRKLKHSLVQVFLTRKSANSNAYNLSVRIHFSVKFEHVFCSITYSNLWVLYAITFCIPLT